MTAPTSQRLESFLTDALGAEALKALRAAISKEPRLAKAMPQRALLSWAIAAIRHDFQGQVPGQADMHLSLRKTEAGFQGQLQTPAGNQMLKGDLLTVVAGLALALELQAEDDSTQGWSDIGRQAASRLGKSLDQLAQTRLVRKEMEIRKGWPKDDAENRANHEAHLVTQDWLQENGKTAEGDFHPYRNPITADNLHAVRHTASANSTQNQNLGSHGPQEPNYGSPPLKTLHATPANRKSRETIDGSRENDGWEKNNPRWAKAYDGGFWHGVDAGVLNNLLSEVANQHGGYSVRVSDPFPQFVDKKADHIQVRTNGNDLPSIIRLSELYQDRPGLELDSEERMDGGQYVPSADGGYQHGLSPDVIDHLRRNFPDAAADENLRAAKREWLKNNPTPIKKALPRDEAENQDLHNSHLVLQDALLEGGKTVAEPHQQVDIPPGTDKKGNPVKDTKARQGRIDQAAYDNARRYGQDFTTPNNTHRDTAFWSTVGEDTDNAALQTIPPYIIDLGQGQTIPVHFSGGYQPGIVRLTTPTSPLVDGLHQSGRQWTPGDLSAMNFLLGEFDALPDDNLTGAKVLQRRNWKDKANFDPKVGDGDLQPIDRDLFSGAGIQRIGNHLHAHRDAIHAHLRQHLPTPTLLGKAERSAGWLPAFRHEQTGKVHSCPEGYHDLNVLPDGNDQGYSSGYVDPQGNFFSREETKTKLGLNGTSSGALHAKQLEKMHGTPTFPKLGMPDNRRETDIVTTPRQVEIKRRSQAASIRHIAKPENQAHYDLPEDISPEDVESATKGVLGDQSVHGALGSVASGPFPGAHAHGDSRQRQLYNTLNPDVQEFNSALNDPTGKSTRSIQQHEDLHGMLNRISEKYGSHARNSLTANLFKWAAYRAPAAAHAAFQAIRRWYDFQPGKQPHEEILASTLNMVNSPANRRDLQMRLGIDDEQMRQLHDKFKIFHQHVLEGGQMANLHWLDGQTFSHWLNSRPQADISTTNTGVREDQLTPLPFLLNRTPREEQLEQQRQAPRKKHFLDDQRPNLNKAQPPSPESQVMSDQLQEQGWTQDQPHPHADPNQVDMAAPQPSADTIPGGVDMGEGGVQYPWKETWTVSMLHPTQDGAGQQWSRYVVRAHNHTQAMAAGVAHHQNLHRLGTTRQAMRNVIQVGATRGHQLPAIDAREPDTTDLPLDKALQKSKLKKGWPRSEAENQANQGADFQHPVAQDQLLSTMSPETKTTVTEPGLPTSRYHEPFLFYRQADGGQRDRMYETGAQNERQNAGNYYRDLQEPNGFGAMFDSEVNAEAFPLDSLEHPVLGHIDFEWDRRSHFARAAGSTNNADIGWGIIGTGPTGVQTLHAITPEGRVVSHPESLEGIRRVGERVANLPEAPIWDAEVGAHLQQQLDQKVPKLNWQPLQPGDMDRQPLGKAEGDDIQGGSVSQGPRPTYKGAEHVRAALDELHANIDHRYNHIASNAKSMGLDPDDFDAADPSLLPKTCRRCQQHLPILQEEIGRCSSTANHLAKKLRGQVFGYEASGDVGASVGEGGDGSGGHDFAVIGGRYIADWWANSYQDLPDLHDLQDPKQRKTIRRLYGDPKKWHLSADYQKNPKARHLWEYGQPGGNGGDPYGELQDPEGYRPALEKGEGPPADPLGAHHVLWDRLIEDGWHMSGLSWGGQALSALSRRRPLAEGPHTLRLLNPRIFNAKGENITGRPTPDGELNYVMTHGPGAENWTGSPQFYNYSIGGQVRHSPHQEFDAQSYLAKLDGQPPTPPPPGGGGLKKMAIKDLKPGQAAGTFEDIHPDLGGLDEKAKRAITHSPDGNRLFNKLAFDYSHLLHSSLQSQGLQMHVYEAQDAGCPSLVARVKHPDGRVIGEAEAPVWSMEDEYLGGREADADKEMHISFAETHPEHRRQGLGKSMYLALMTHGYHNHGVRKVTGGRHSTLAHHTHESISGEHGLGYKAKEGRALPPLDSKQEPGAFDNAYGPYGYKLKAEVKPGVKKKDLMPGGKGDNQPDSSFDPEQLQIGTQTEQQEHGLDGQRASEVAKDHLTVDPDYYQEHLGKAWPKDEQENQQNAATHQVLGDALAERGAQELDPQTATQLARNAAAKVNEEHWMDKRRSTRTRMAQTDNQLQDFRANVAAGAIVPEDTGPAEPLARRTPASSFTPKPTDRSGFQQIDNHEDDLAAEQGFWQRIGRAAGINKKELSKGWPRSEAQNRDNQAGFIRESPPTEDRLMEQGLGDKTIHTVSRMVRDNGKPTHAAELSRWAISTDPRAAAPINGGTPAGAAIWEAEHSNQVLNGEESLPGVVGLSSEHRFTPPTWSPSGPTRSENTFWDRLHRVTMNAARERSVVNGDTTVKVQKLPKAIATNMARSVHEAEHHPSVPFDPKAPLDDRGRVAKKTEMPGQTHQPTKQIEPQAPQGPEMQPAIAGIAKKPRVG